MEDWFGNLNQLTNLVSTSPENTRVLGTYGFIKSLADAPDSIWCIIFCFSSNNYMYPYTMLAYMFIMHILVVPWLQNTFPTGLSIFSPSMCHPEIPRTPGCHMILYFPRFKAEVFLAFCILFYTYIMIEVFPLSSAITTLLYHHHFDLPNLGVLWYMTKALMNAMR